MVPWGITLKVTAYKALLRMFPHQVLTVGL